MTTLEIITRKKLGQELTAEEIRFFVQAAAEKSVPDYQLLSVFAKALDATSALGVQDFNSRNPMTASGAALDSGSPLATLGQMAADPQLAADDAAVGGATARASALSQAGLYRMQGQTALNSLKGYKTHIGINAWTAALSSGLSAFAMSGGFQSSQGNLSGFTPFQQQGVPLPRA